MNSKSNNVKYKDQTVNFFVLQFAFNNKQTSKPQINRLIYDFTNTLSRSLPSL